MEIKEVTHFVIYENGERREITQPVKIYENGHIIEVSPALGEGQTKC